MWIKAETVEAVSAVARVWYVDWQTATRWNEHRRPGELRLMTGWVWTAKDGSDERGGIKTQTAAIIEAYYRLVLKAAPPRATRPRLRVVEPAAKGRAA